MSSICNLQSLEKKFIYEVSINNLNITDKNSVKYFLGKDILLSLNKIPTSTFHTAIKNLILVIPRELDQKYYLNQKLVREAKAKIQDLAYSFCKDRPNSKLLEISHNYQEKGYTIYTDDYKSYSMTFENGVKINKDLYIKPLTIQYKHIDKSVIINYAPYIHYDFFGTFYFDMKNSNLCQFHSNLYNNDFTTWSNIKGLQFETLPLNQFHEADYYHRIILDMQKIFNQVNEAF